MSFHKYVNVGSALALMCPAMTMAQATPAEQAAASNTLQEIIVTATRREETILDVPISIAAYTQQALNQKGVRNIEDLARITPGLSIMQGFSGIKYISIRGVESRWGATTTGVYIDETPVQVQLPCSSWKVGRSADNFRNSCSTTVGSRPPESPDSSIQTAIDIENDAGDVPRRRLARRF